MLLLPVKWYIRYDPTIATRLLKVHPQRYKVNRHLLLSTPYFTGSDNVKINEHAFATAPYICIIVDPCIQSHHV